MKKIIYSIFYILFLLTFNYLLIFGFFIENFLFKNKNPIFILIITILINLIVGFLFSKANIDKKTLKRITLFVIILKFLFISFIIKISFSDVGDGDAVGGLILITTLVFIWTMGILDAIFFVGMVIGQVLQKRKLKKLTKNNE